VINLLPKNVNIQNLDVVLGICSTADLESEQGLMLRDKQVNNFDEFSISMHAFCYNYVNVGNGA
jgi:hypothetical protein